MLKLYLTPGVIRAVPVGDVPSPKLLVTPTAAFGVSSQGLFRLPGRFGGVDPRKKFSYAAIGVQVESETGIILKGSRLCRQRGTGQQRRIDERVRSSPASQLAFQERSTQEIGFVG